MKKITLLLVLIVSGFFASAQLSAKPDSTKKLLVVETACGQCKFSLPGKSCDLAVRIDGKAMFVDGTHIDAHGDAHDETGFCNAIRKAEVQGTVVNDRYVVTYFKLLKKE